MCEDMQLTPLLKNKQNYLTDAQCDCLYHASWCSQYPFGIQNTESLSAMFAHSAHFTHDKRLYGGLTFSNRFFEVSPSTGGG